MSSFWKFCLERVESRGTYEELEASDRGIIGEGGSYHSCYMQQVLHIMFKEINFLAKGTFLLNKIVRWSGRE